MKPLKERIKNAAAILGCTVEELEAAMAKAEQRAEERRTPEGCMATRWDMGPDGFSVTVYFTTPDAMQAYYKRVEYMNGG